MKSRAESDVNVRAYTVNLGRGRGAPMAATVVVTRSDITSTAQIAPGATVEAGGVAEVRAEMEKNLNASALGGAYEDGSVGIGASAAINEIESDTKAVVGQPVFDPERAVDDDEIDLGYVHGLKTGDAVVYDNGGGDSIGGLTTGTTYCAIVVNPSKIELAATQQNAKEGIAIELARSGAHGEAHSFRNAGETLGSGTVVARGDAMIYAVNRTALEAGSARRRRSPWPTCRSKTSRADWSKSRRRRTSLPSTTEHMLRSTHLTTCRSWPAPATWEPCPVRWWSTSEAS
jgi:hypothetical protein